MEMKYDNTFHITKNNIFSMIHSKQISYDGVSYYFQEENFFKNWCLIPRDQMIHSRIEDQNLVFLLQVAPDEFLYETAIDVESFSFKHVRLKKDNLEVLFQTTFFHPSTFMALFQLEETLFFSFFDQEQFTYDVARRQGFYSKANQSLGVGERKRVIKKS